MLQRPRFNSYSDGSRSPLADKQTFGKHKHLIKKQYKSHDMLTETLHSPTIETLKNDQLRANGTLNRNPSKIRRLSALLNKKFNRNRLSREKISPPVLVTASSFIEAVPIAKPAKELACVEKSTTTSHALNPSHGAGLSGQLSRQSSKSSTHTLQRQLSEREILRLGSQKVTKHNGFLSGSSLSSFTSDGSSDKHSSYGTYNREGLSASYAPATGNDWTVSNSEALDNYSPFPILSESFNQQTTEWERVALAKQFKADCISNANVISSTISESEETPSAECEIPNSDVVSLTEVSSPLHRFSHPNITTSPKWTDIETKERVKSDYGTYIDVVSKKTSSCIRHSLSTNPEKTKWRDAVIYAKDSEDYEHVLSKMEGPEHNSRLPEEDSILEFLASMSPTSSEDSFIDPPNSLLDSNHTNSVGTDMELETGIDHGVTTKISEECDLMYKSSQSHMSTDKVDTYRHSIFDLYHYESDDEDEVLEPASTEISAKYEIDNYAAYTTNNSTVTNLIEELDRL